MLARSHSIVFAWRRVTPPLFMGGAEVSTRILSRQLANAGYRVSCLGSYEDPRSGASALDEACAALARASISHTLDTSVGSVRYDYHGVSCTMTRQGNILDELKKQLRGLQDQVIVFSAQEDSDEIIRCSREFGAVTVGWLHSSSAVGLAVLRGMPTHVLATSRFVADQAREQYGCECILFYPPFDDVVFRNSTDSVARRAITLINPIPDKGVDLFLALARELPGRQFLAIEAWYPVQLPAEDLRRNVQYLTRLVDLGPVYQQTRVLLVPSRIDEGFGRVVIEAGLHGVPALVSAMGGLVETIGNGPGLIMSRDLKTWTQALRDLDSEGEYAERCEIARRNAIRYHVDPVLELVKAGVLAGNHADISG